MSDKVTLAEMATLAQSEAERIDTWERVLASEGKPLDPGIARRRTIFRKMMATIDLLSQHQFEFANMVIFHRDKASERPRSRSA